MKKQTINMQIEKAKKQLKKWEDTLKNFESQESKETYEWFDIPEKSIQVTKLIHKDKTLAEARSLLNKGEEVCSYELIQWLRNSDKYRDLLGLNDTWCFVYPNPDKVRDKLGEVAWFNAYSDRAYLYCVRNPTGSYSSLGVFIFRRKKFKRSNNE